MSETDPELGATWRATSREEPPAALDNALRAAARREVGAKPGRLRAAPRWWPLAAAATVAAVAVGIVQMTPPEQVTPATFPSAMDATPRDVKADANKPTVNGPQSETRAAAAPELKRDTQREDNRPVAAKEQQGRAADEKNPRAGDRAGGFAVAREARFQEKKTMPELPAQRVEEERNRGQGSKQKTELAAASPLARQNASAASPSAAPAPRNELQPFPASPVPAEVGAVSAPPPAVAAAPAAQPAPAFAARKLAAQSSVASVPSANNASSVSSGGAGNAEPAAAKDPAALGKIASTEADNAAPERRKVSSAFAPDEWIKRIRRLVAEGRNEDAAKELAAFRREYKERSDALLPSDLRAFRP